MSVSSEPGNNVEASALPPLPLYPRKSAVWHHSRIWKKATSLIETSLTVFKQASDNLRSKTEEAAATVIQARWRGKAAKMSFVMMRISAIRVARAWKVCSTRRCFASKKSRFSSDAWCSLKLHDVRCRG